MNINFDEQLKTSFGAAILSQTPECMEDAVQGINAAVVLCHGAAFQAGWWHDLETGECLIGKRNHGEMMMLMVTEIAEGFEGVRKNLMDDHLPHRPAVEVELADLIIRCFDYTGAHGLDLAGAFREKIEYNHTRPDHRREARLADNGKKF